MSTVYAGNDDTYEPIEGRENKTSFPVKDMEKILSALANEDALRIFREAKSGIASSTETIEELGLTQKRYYARLRSLIETGLIEKTEKGYDLTFLGRIVYEILYRKLEKTLENKDRIAIIDKLNKAGSLTKEEKEQIASAIAVKDRILGYTNLLGGIKPVEIITTFDDLVNVVIALIKKASDTVFFAARYTDARISEPLIGAFNRGVRFFFLDGDESNLSNRMQIIRIIFSNPKLIHELRELLSSPNVRIRYVNLPYSFAVVDGEYAAIEIVNPVDKEFLFGLLFHNKEICGKLIKMFNEYSEKSEQNYLAELITSKLRP